MSDPLDLSGANNNSPQKSRVTKLQEKLYSPNTQFQIRSRHGLKREVNDVPQGWQDVDNNSFSQVVSKNKMTVFTKILIVAFVFFVAALGFAFYKFAGIAPTQFSSTVDLTVIGPVSIGGGEEMSLDFIIQNKNSFPLEVVDMVIEYPEGTKTADLRQDLPRFREGLGDIPANSILKKTYSAALFGEEGEQKSIDARIEYRVPNSNAIFETRKSFELVLQSSPVRLVVDTVKEITSGQALNFDITVASNSNSDLENVLVTVDYPFGFSFSESTIAPSKGNNTWYFEKLSPQESKKFTLRGSLVGQNNEERVFKWNIGLAEPENKDNYSVKFTMVPKSVSLIRPFLALDLAIDGDLGVDVVKKGGTQIDGRLTFKNNTGSVIVDPQIVLKLDGEVLDDPSVDLEGGFFNSADNTITWNKVTNSEIFKEISVGESETLAFTFKSKTLASRQAVFKNPEIVASATITGKRVGEDNVPEDIKVDIAKRIKFVSDLNLSAQTSHVSGPFPPKVEQDTVYKITLDVTNSSNLINRGKVKAVLPPYVRWNNSFAPSTEKVTYSPSSRTIEWDLGDIREHVGFIDPSRSISFDVTLTPSASQIGQSPQLLVDPTFTGYDSFTQTDVSQTIVAPTTDMGRLSDLETSKVVE